MAGTDGVSAEPEVPLRHDAEGFPVFADWDENDMEARVAAERARLQQAHTAAQDTAQEEPAGVSMDDLDEFIKAADAKSNGTAKATARRHGPRKTAAPPVEAKPVPKPTTDKRTRQIEDISDEQLLADAGITPFYSTTEAAEFFDRTNQWLYWGLGRDADKGKGPIFIYPDGTPIEPERIGDPVTGRRRFTLPIIKEILLSSYRRGNIEPEELKKILRRIRINEMGGEWREREGWHKIRGKWIHPSKCEQVDGKWVRKAGTEEDDDGE